MLLERLCMRADMPTPAVMIAIEALCIVEVGASRWGRLLHTHPPISERVERLQAMEARLQARAP